MIIQRIITHNFLIVNQAIGSFRRDFLLRNFPIADLSEFVRVIFRIRIPDTGIRIADRPCNRRGYGLEGILDCSKRGVEIIGLLSGIYSLLQRAVIGIIIRARKDVLRNGNVRCFAAQRADSIGGNSIHSLQIIVSCSGNASQLSCIGPIVRGRCSSCAARSAASCAACCASGGCSDRGPVLCPLRIDASRAIGVVCSERSCPGIADKAACRCSRGSRRIGDRNGACGIGVLDFQAPVFAKPSEKTACCTASGGKIYVIASLAFLCIQVACLLGGSIRLLLIRIGRIGRTAAGIAVCDRYISGGTANETASSICAAGAADISAISF